MWETLLLTIYCLDNEKSDFVLKDPEFDSHLYRLIFYFGKTTDSYTRSYTKFQEVIAQIGGFSSMINMFLLMIYEKMGLLFKYRKIMKKIRLANSHLITNNPTHISIKDDLQNADYIRVKWKTQNCYQSQSIEKKIESLESELRKLKLENENLQEVNK